MTPFSDPLWESILIKRTLLLVSAVTAPVLLTGCSDGDGSAAKTTPSTSPAPGAPMVPAGQRVTASRVTVTVPTGWKKVDPTTDSSDVVASTYGLKDMAAENKELLVKAKQKGAVWALDPSTGPENATNLLAACESGPQVGGSLETLRILAGIFNKGAKITDTTVGGKPALRIASTATSALTHVTSETIEVRVPVSDTEYCYVQVKAEPGALGPVADQILTSFTVN